MQQSDFDQWRDGPVGKWFFDTILAEEIARRDQAIGSGTALLNDPGETAMRYANETGLTAGLELARRIDPFKEVRDESRGDRPTAPDKNGD